MATITHTPATGWGFTIGNQSYTGFPTRDAAAEAAYDIEKTGAAYSLARGGSAPAAPAVRVTHVESEGNRWIDFETGDGLTKVLVSPRDWQDAGGVYLIIGGHGINDYLDEVIELADLRQLRDNLTALLADERLIAALGEPPAPAQPAIRVVPHICDDKVDPRYGKEVTWIDYVVDTPVGAIEVGVSDHWPPKLDTQSMDLGELADWAHWVPAIMALLQHPDVKAALARKGAGAPPVLTRKAA